MSFTPNMTPHCTHYKVLFHYSFPSPMEFRALQSLFIPLHCNLSLIITIIENVGSVWSKAYIIDRKSFEMSRHGMDKEW